MSVNILSPSLLLIFTPWFTSGTSFLSPCRRIDAAVRWSSSNVSYFFSADELIKYNDAFDVEEEVLSVADITDNFPSNIDAAVSWFGRRKSLYFKECYFYKFDEIRRRLRRRPLSRLGLPCHVDAAFNNDGHNLIVFKGCQYWRITRSNRRAVLAGSLSDLRLPCNVDAALTWRNGISYVIKDDVVWPLSSSLTAENRSLVDDWNLCSWRICESEDANTTAGMPLEPDFPCNGDPRFCALRFDQVTLAGSHNAGSGFDGGFGFFSCWVRNQYMTVLEQLRFGVRFLDVDTSWEHCGLLGSFHNFLCGGPVCKMIKQIKQFLKENRHEVVAINFNHEMQDVERVMPAITRQMTSQLGLYLNSEYRNTRLWPVLRDAVISNQRLFVFLGKRLTTRPMLTSYVRNPWLHGEQLLHSTWRADVSVNDNCQAVLESAHQQCHLKRHTPLLEVSILGYSTSCVTTIADLCLPLVHQISRGCQAPRHGGGKAPNVLLVDYPERTPRPALSVVSAAFLQNVRNVANLSIAQCRPTVDSAVWWRTVEGEEQILFFSGSHPIVYNWHLHTQDNLGEHIIDSLTAPADAVFKQLGVSDEVCFVKECSVECHNAMTHFGGQPTMTTSLISLGLPCGMQAAFTRGNSTYFFKGCQYWQMLRAGQIRGPHSITMLSLPCDIDAAFQAPDGATYYFKLDSYWKETNLGLSDPKHILEWSADFVQCHS